MARACGEGYHLGAQASSAKPFADALFMHELRGEAMLVKVQCYCAMQGQVRTFLRSLRGWKRP